MVARGLAVPLISSHAAVLFLARVASPHTGSLFLLGSGEACDPYVEVALRDANHQMLQIGFGFHPTLSITIRCMIAWASGFRIGLGLAMLRLGMVDKVQEKSMVTQQYQRGVFERTRNRHDHVYISKRVDKRLQHTQLT